MLSYPIYIHPESWRTFFSQIIGDFQQCETMGGCLLNLLLVRVKLLILWDFCHFFKVLLKQLLKFLLICLGLVNESDIHFGLTGI